MRIVFICNCLEPGRDGVGDYTRRIAAQITVLGHNVAAIALNDDFVSGFFEETLPGNHTEVKIFRIPASFSLKQRTGIAKQLVDGFNPDWVSLQFVIFGYHAKGLPFGLGRQLKAIAHHKKWTIMFHELWVAMEQEANFKHNIWGRLQRTIIRSVINILKPRVLFTHTALYIHELGKLGINACMLPLFGNIPIVKITAVSPGAGQIDSKQPLNLVLFGNIHAQAPVNYFAEEAAAFSHEHKIPLILLLSGRNGSEQQLWVNEWEAAGLQVKVLGEQSPADISALFSTATLGVSTTPVAVIEKSGSVAAMHEHGLPVLNVSAQWVPKSFKMKQPPAGVMVYQKGNLSEILSGKLSLPNVNNVNAVAQQFVNALQNGC